jgi:hypothetical protein
LGQDSYLHRHETHRRPAHRLAKHLGVGAINLAALHIRLDQLRRYQLHLVAERPQKPWDAPQASIPITVGASALKKATIFLRRSFLRAPP